LCDLSYHRGLFHEFQHRTLFARHSTGADARHRGFRRLCRRWLLLPPLPAQAATGSWTSTGPYGGIVQTLVYAENLLSPSVITRPLQGEVPTIDLVIGCKKANTSPVLKRFLGRTDELITRVQKRLS